MYFTLRAHGVIDLHLQGQNLMDEMKIMQGPSPYNKYIVFRRCEEGQGAGNVINGLLAAHMLGEEFGRLVCISKEKTDLLEAFKPKIPQALLECPSLPSRPENMTLDIQLLNFGSVVAPNECELRSLFASDEPIIWFSGNTYPRWPDVPDNFFAKFYEPTQQLKEILPWKEPPKTVVHLRHGDSRRDHRKGVDMDTLRKLGTELPSDTFLVTNWLSWYKFFEVNYGWRHPSWVSVKHSALLGVRWADVDRKANVSKTERNLQLWADWYTILMAKYVVHTHSDFSLSAIHGMNIESRTVQGILPDGTLHLTEEWWRDGEAPQPLVQRSEEKSQGCKAPPPEHKTIRKPVKELLAERRESIKEKDNAKETAEESQDDKRERQRAEKHEFVKSK
jgi:hypothetical protein